MSLIKDNLQISCLIKKKISVYLRINEKIEGILIGFDQFLNLVLDDSSLYLNKEEKKVGIVLIRGNNINSIEY
jgi:small nuclear ribonucleoprotein G